MADLTSNQLCNICRIHYNAGLRCCSLGTLLEGGYLFARQGGLAWIVACSSREVSRDWTSRGDAVTVANASNPCGDWFVPDRHHLSLGQMCSSFWDSFSNTAYWSNTDGNVLLTYAWHVCFQASPNYGSISRAGARSCVRCVRAFRRIFY